MSRSALITLLVLTLILTFATHCTLSEKTYKSLSVIEWQKSDIIQFIENEFDDYAEVFREELEDKDFSGNDLIMLDEEDLERLGIEDALVRSQILDKIHLYAERASKQDEEATSRDFSQYWLPQDITRPEHERRFNLKKLEDDDPRHFFAYIFMWSSSPFITFWYFHYTDPDFLKRMLHLPLTYEFSMQDYILYTLLGRAVVSYRVYELGYFESNFYASLVFCVAHVGHLLAATFSLVTIKLVNPVAQIFPTAVSSFGIIYIMPLMVLNWKLIGGTLLMQGLSALPQAIMQAKMTNMIKNVKKNVPPKQTEAEADDTKAVEDVADEEPNVAVEERPATEESEEIVELD